MEPTLRNRSIVLASSIPYLFLNPSISDIIVFQRGEKTFIKRIQKIENGRYFLVGDNQNDSMDSRKFGWIHGKQIVGKVILKL